MLTHRIGYLVEPVTACQFMSSTERPFRRVRQYHRRQR